MGIKDMAAKSAAARGVFERGKRIALQAFLDDSNLTHEQKLHALERIVSQVLALHRSGRYGFDIYPGKMYTVNRRAVFKPCLAQLQNTGVLPIRPGYSAPERYSGEMTGPWTDVYALSALFLRFMTGSAPPPAFEREDIMIQIEPVPEKIRPLARIVAQGLCLRSEKRPPLDKLAAELKTLLPAADEVKVKAKKHRFFRRRFSAAFCALIILVGGAAAVSEINYAEALKLIQNGSYAKASRALDGVPAFYRDTKELLLYAQASGMLEQGRYEQAAELFLSLGSFRDAAGMALLSQYRGALQLLETGRHESARTAFLALGGFEDAIQMADEAAYRLALHNMKDGKLLEAQEALRALHPDKDTKELLSNLDDKIFEKARTYYEREQYEQAAVYFAALRENAQAKAYGRVCSLALAMLEGCFSRAQYEELLCCAAHVDIAHFALSDAVIQLFLEGKWNDGTDTFTLEANGSISSSLPMGEGEHFFRDAALFCRQNGREEEKVFLFGYINNNTISLYCCASTATYTLTRQV